MKTLQRNVVLGSVLGAFLTLQATPLLAAPTKVQAAAAKTAVSTKTVDLAGGPIELSDDQMGEVKGEFVVFLVIGGMMAIGAISGYYQFKAHQENHRANGTQHHVGD